MSFHKKAFTLVELSIVIGLIAFIAIIFSNFDFSASTTQQKRDRLTWKISDVIRSLRTISTTGRTFSGSTTTCADFALTINTGSITTQYIQLSDTGVTTSVCGTDQEHSIASPIFGDKNYAIKYMTGADIAGNTTFCMGDCGGITAPQTADSVKLVIKSWEVKIHPIYSGVENFSGSTVSVTTRTTYMEKAGVAGETTLTGKKIHFDSRSGQLCTNDNCQ